MEQYMWIIWLSVFVITLIVDVTVSGLISIWLSLSAVIVLGLSFIPALPYWGEIILFIGLSFLFLIATRPFVKKFLKPHEEVKANAESFVHKRYFLTKEIIPHEFGEVKINGVLWDCKTQCENDSIPANTEVEVLAIEGNKLIVKEVKNND